LKEVINPRADTTAKKYRQQIEWRRNKVKEMLISEISSALRISQPTISRDLNYIYQEKKRRQKKHADELFLELRNTIAGLAELVKKSWAIVDDVKTDHKERMKAMSLIVQCYDKKLELLDLEPQVNNYKEYTDNIMNKEKELLAKEKMLEAHREGKKLSWHELRFAVDSNAVF
jgi:hypothetical protein